MSTRCDGSGPSGPLFLRLRSEHGEVHLGQVRYYTDELLDLHGSVVQVQVDRYDPSRVAAQVNGAWIECPAVDLPERFRVSPEELEAARRLDELMDDVARIDYESSVQVTGKAAYRHLVARCAEEGVEPLSYSSWMRYLRRRRQSTAIQPRSDSLLTAVNPPSPAPAAPAVDGERFLEVAPLDYHQFDVLHAKPRGLRLSMILDTWTGRVVRIRVWSASPGLEGEEPS